MIDPTAPIVPSATEADFRRWSRQLPVNAEYDDLRGVDLPPLLLAEGEAVVGSCVTVTHPGAALPEPEADAWEVVDFGTFLLYLGGWCLVAIAVIGLGAWIWWFAREVLR